MNFIVAVDNKYAIGKNGMLIYHLPSDLKYFKEQTLNKVVVMGERTFLSLPKRPLSNRTNIVLSADGNKFDGAITVQNLLELKNVLQNYDDSEIFVIGGASVYNLLMDYCKFAYITKIDGSEPADTFINNIEKMPNWKLISKSKTQEENNLKFCFCVFENKKVKSL